MKFLALFLIVFAFVEAQDNTVIHKEIPVGNGAVFGSVGAPGSGGLEGRAGYRGTIANGDLGKLDGQGYASRSLGGPLGPVSGYGGRLDWTGSRGAAAVEAQHNIGFGTQLNAEGSGTIWRRGNAQLDATGQYSRTFGGPFRSRPDYSVGARFKYNF